MRIASVAWPFGATVIAVGGLFAIGLRSHAPAAQPEPAPQEIRCADAPPQAPLLNAPDNARYWQVDMDGDGTPEMVAETDDRANAIVVRAYRGAPIATIALRQHGCQDELTVEDGVLVAHDYGGPNCAEIDTRTFRILDGHLSTVTVLPTRITIVDN